MKVCQLGESEKLTQAIQRFSLQASSFKLQASINEDAISGGDPKTDCTEASRRTG
jgi:hypothetical protein